MRGRWRNRLGPRLAPFSLLLAPSAGVAQTPPDRPPTAPGTAPAPAPALPALTRPVPKGALDVAYPEGAAGEAAVVLELVLDEHGRVTGVSVVSGDEPFASAAAAAARAFEFEPARRGDTAISARIRVEVRFTPPIAAPPEPDPRPVEAGAPPPRVPRVPAAATARATPPLAVEPVEIVIQGQRPEPATSSLGRAEVREIPGTFGDPFRAIEVMPGVAPIATGVPFFFVRGAPPGNVGYFLDGIRVPLLYHAALGPSVIHPGLVQRVDLYSGGYPARFGRFAGGIVSAETAPPKDTFHGEANLRVFDAGALVEAPFAGGAGTALVAGRYSYTAAILSLIAPEVDLSYWDYQARVYYALTPTLRVGVFSFGAYDKFFAEDSEGERQGAATQFHRLDLRLEARPSPSTEARLAFTVGVDRSETPGDEDERTTELSNRLLGVRGTLEHRLGRAAALRAGADFQVDEYELGTDAFERETRRDVLGTRTDYSTGVHADLVLEPAPGVRVTPGVRADVYVSRGVAVLGIDPRVAASFEVSRRVTLEHTFGIARQPPSFVVPVPGLQLSDLEDGLQRSLQSSAGVVVRPGRGWQLGGTLFHNAFLNLTDQLGSELARDASELTGSRDNRPDARVLGQSYGVELSARRPLTEDLAGYFAYTLSRTTRSVGGARALAAFDRPHVLHAAAAYDLGRRYRLGARLSAYSGMPAEQEDDDPNGPGNWLEGRNDGPGGPRGRFDRAPTFYRLDLRFEKSWLIGREGANLSLVLELLNATLSKETIEYECRPSGCTGEVIGPVTIPSVGLEAFF